MSIGKLTVVLLTLLILSNLFWLIHYLSQNAPSLLPFPIIAVFIISLLSIVVLLKHLWDFIQNNWD